MQSAAAIAGSRRARGRAAGRVAGKLMRATSGAGGGVRVAALRRCGLSVSPGGVAGRFATRAEAGRSTVVVAAGRPSLVLEHMLIPLCGALILYGFHRSGQSTTFRLAWGNGQFILVRREAYARIGGHACSRQTVIEDIPSRAGQAERLKLRTPWDRILPRSGCTRTTPQFATVGRGFSSALCSVVETAGQCLVADRRSLLPCIGAPVAAGIVAGHGWPAARWATAIIVLLWLHAVRSARSVTACGPVSVQPALSLAVSISTVAVLGIVLRAWWWMVTGRRSSGAAHRPAAVAGFAALHIIRGVEHRGVVFSLVARPVDGCAGGGCGVVKVIRLSAAALAALP